MPKLQSGAWPRENRPPFYSSRPAPAGLPVLSRSGDVRGITLGGGGPCPSSTCDGFLICVDWETGQCLYPCSKGWELREDPEPHYRITDGGEISARWINPVAPPPRDQWAKRIVRSDIDWIALGYTGGI
jgi:hypothetical protein